MISHHKRLLCSPSFNEDQRWQRTEVLKRIAEQNEDAFTVFELFPPNTRMKDSSFPPHRNAGSLRN
jgi:hypothetical protein